MASTRATGCSELAAGGFSPQAAEVVLEFHGLKVTPFGVSAATPSGERGALQSAMADEALIRLENLQALLDARGWGIPELRARCGRSPSFWSDLLRGQKSFGEKLARDIEAALDLPRGHLDSAEDHVTEPLSGEVLSALATRSPEERERIENSVRALLGMPLLPAVASGKRVANGRT